MSLSSEPKPSWQSLPCTVTLLTAPLVPHRLSLLWAGQPRGGWLWAARTAVQATSLWKYQGQKDNAFSWDMKKEAALLRWPRHAEVTWLHRVRAVPAASHPALSLAPWRGMGRTAFTTWTCCHSHPDVSCYLTSALSSPFAASSQRRSGPFKNELCAWAVPPPLGPAPRWCPCPGGAQLAQHGRCQLPIQLADGWLGMGGIVPGGGCPMDHWWWGAKTCAMSASLTMQKAVLPPLHHQLPGDQSQLRFGLPPLHVGSPSS